jgi:tetratricopeptide (TPR) repeat protein
LKALIPYFIQERFRENQTMGKLEAFTMFVDISGFTAMTESLMQKGNEGAEQLSLILNEIFEPLVALVYEENGFIPYFAGDAFTAIFPTEHTAISADRFLRLALKIRNFFTENTFSFGFDIKAKIGLGYGEVHYGIVGEQKHSFYFRGKAIESAAECQLKAAAQEVIVDLPLYQRVRAESNGFWKLAPIKDSWYIVENQDDFYKKMLFTEAEEKFDPVIGQNFLPKSVIDFNQSGEFRSVITLFIAFEGANTHNELNKLASLVLTQTDNFSGYFKEIDYSDKGGLMIIIFGAPVSYENSTQRALEFALSVKQSASDIKGVKLKIGISSGIAYTGIIGGKERCQYAAVGTSVNLAARFMSNSKWGEIFCDKEISRNKGFRFAYEGSIAYKGIAQNIATYQLLGRRSDEELSYQNVMIGREAELAILTDFASPILQQQFVGVAYLYGEAGIGKSRLSFELKKNMEQQGVKNWLVCQSDQILRKPFNPFIYCLKYYFDQSIDKPLADNQQSFDENFEILLKDCLNTKHNAADNIIKELVRTKSILSGLVGLVEENSLWEQLDAKGRYENTLAALSNFFVAEAMLQPTIIALEDTHWYDEDSKRFLQQFLKNITDFPVFILVTSRYNDDNTKSDIFATLQGINNITIDLNILQADALQKMAELRFGGKIDDTFSAFLQRSSNGNPFYAEQVLEYFLESNLLESSDDGVWTVKDKTLKLSGSMNTVLTARVDRLSFLVRETVKAAAVIGREFELPILSEVMRKQEEFALRNGNQSLLLKEQVQTAEKSQIWQAMNELRYIFKHSLLREAIYDMQLRARLRELHRNIAEAIEKIYAQNIEERYADLAFHYEQGEVIEKTIFYLNKAADYAKRNYQNVQSLEYFEKLLTYFPKKENTNEVIKVLLRKGELLQTMGNWTGAENDFEQIITLAHEGNDEKSLMKAYGLLGNVLLLKGNYEKSKENHDKGLLLANQLQDFVGESRSLGGIGNLYFRQGDYEKAEIYFNQCLDAVKKVDTKFINPQIVANLGLTYMNQSRYEEGIACMLAQLEICEAQKDKNGMATIHTNLGIVYLEEGNFDAAKHHFQAGLAQSEALGNNFLLSIALGSLGNVYEKKGDFDTAESLYQRDLQLTEQLGDKQGIAIAFGLLGGLYCSKGEHDKALTFLEKNLTLCKTLNYQKGVVKALNLLGDLYTQTKQYAKAISHYEQSMEVAKKINSQLLYALNAIELAQVHLETSAYEKALALEKEVEVIAIVVNNKQLQFEYQVLKASCARIEKKNDIAEQTLQNLMLSETLTEEEEAIVYYELTLLKKNEQGLRQKVTAMYIELYRKTPKYLYINRLNQLGSVKKN